MKINNKINRQNKRRNAKTKNNDTKGAQIVRYTPSVFGFPTRLVAKLRYSAYEGLYLSSIAGSIGKQLFSANSIFDPDRTNTGHQPMYRDTYAAIYDQYAVIESRITVRFINQNAAASEVIGVVMEDDSSSSTNINTLVEQNLSTASVLGPVSSSNSVRVLTRDFKCIRDLNIDPYSSEMYKTAQTTVPAEEYFFLCFAQDIGGGTTNTLIQAEIEYTVLFTELTTPTSS